MENMVLILILLVIVGLAARYIYKAKKSGKKCIGCPASCSCSSGKDSSGCSGCCAGRRQD